MIAKETSALKSSETNTPSTFTPNLNEEGSNEANRGAGISIIGGGGQIFIYSCSAQLISFEIDCFTVCDHEYMNICPPPNYRYSGASGSKQFNQST
jgi:hypothetical protein